MQKIILLPLLWIACLSSSCSQILDGKDQILAFLVDFIPIEIEQALGERTLESVVPKNMRLVDAKAQAALESLMQPLLRLPQHQQKPRIIISQSQELNAFALPGGILVFNQGMLLAAESPEEILGVAAHELAHVSERHVMSGLVQSMGLMAIVSAVFGDVEGLAALLVGQGTRLVQSGFSRRHESEADAVGFNSMVAAKLDPRGMVRFFQRLEKIKQQDPQNPMVKLQSFFSTHPLTGERIETIAALYEQLPNSEKKSLKKSNFPLKNLQDNLRDK